MLEAFADGVWFDTGPVRFLGLRLTATMTVIRIEDGVLVHSPLPLTPERRAAVSSLGRVAHLYAPNTLHHAWLSEIPIVGFRLIETVLVHRASRTAVVTDLVHNVSRPSHRWTKIYATMMGFYDRIALSRMLRWTAFDDRRAARASVDRLLSAPFEGLIVGHGLPIAARGHELLALAMQFLPEPAAARLPSGSKRSSLLSAKPCG